MPSQSDRVRRTGPKLQMRVRATADSVWAEVHVQLIAPEIERETWIGSRTEKRPRAPMRPRARSVRL